MHTSDDSLARLAWMIITVCRRECLRACAVCAYMLVSFSCNERRYKQYTHSEENPNDEPMPHHPFVSLASSPFGFAGIFCRKSIEIKLIDHTTQITPLTRNLCVSVSVLENLIIKLDYRSKWLLRIYPRLCSSSVFFHSHSLIFFPHSFVNYTLLHATFALDIQIVILLFLLPLLYSFSFSFVGVLLASNNSNNNKIID